MREDDFYFWRCLWQELCVITVWENGKGKGGGRNRERREAAAWKDFMDVKVFFPEA